jgi:hypothetical protein
MLNHSVCLSNPQPPDDAMTAFMAVLNGRIESTGTERFALFDALVTQMLAALTLEIRIETQATIH